MADLKITSAVVNDIVALQKSAATIGKKTEAQQQADNSRADAAVQVDVNPKTAALAEASPPTELNPDVPVIAE